MSQRWLPGLDGSPLFGWGAATGALSITVAVAFMFAVAFAGTFASALALAVAGVGAIAGLAAGLVTGAIAGLAAGLVTGAGESASAITGTITGTVAGLVPGIVVGAVTGAGAGLAVRALFFRFAATLSCLPAGIRHLPENWREINSLTDSFLPAELMPGIRSLNTGFALDGWTKAMLNEKKRPWRVLRLSLGIFWFLPAFLYRLNIKATAWFWWPLAYLLKPAPVADAEGQQKQALCWPWTNPFQKLWIIASVLLVVVSLTLHILDLASWAALKGVPALPLALKVSLAIDWTHLAPWHLAQWIIAGTGLGMLLLAGNARSHDVNGNWREYRQRWPRNIRLMTGLQRLRTLATIALLLMALGGLLLQDRSWQAHLPVPESVIRGMEHFYRIQG